MRSLVKPNRPELRLVSRSAPPAVLRAAHSGGELPALRPAPAQRAPRRRIDSLVQSTSTDHRPPPDHPLSPSLIARRRRIPAGSPFSPVAAGVHLGVSVAAIASPPTAASIRSTVKLAICPTRRRILSHSPSGQRQSRRTVSVQTQRTLRHKKKNTLSGL